MYKQKGFDPGIGVGKAERKANQAARKAERNANQDERKAKRKANQDERKADRDERKEERAYNKETRKEERASNKLRGTHREKSKITSGDDWEKTTVKSNGKRTVIKQKNKTGNVRSTHKTVYGPDGGKITSKVKQRANKAGRDAGIPTFKNKEVDRRDFSVRSKTRGTTNY